MTIQPIVEGHGEAQAVPLLVRRIADAVAPGRVQSVLRPIRVHRQQLVRSGELERTIELAGRHTRPSDAILIVLDADADCPADLAPVLLSRARGARADRHHRVVLATREYEAWFLAGAESLAGYRGLRANFRSPPDPEAVSDCKGHLSAWMEKGMTYSSTLDQAAMTARLDLAMARTAPSFDKLWRDIQSLLDAVVE